MAYPASWSERKETVLTVAHETYGGLERWRDDEPGAAFEEIEFGAQRRRKVMADGLAFPIDRQGAACQAEGVECSVCGGWMEFKGYLPWAVYGLDGGVRVARAYYVCPRCKEEKLSPSWM